MHRSAQNGSVRDTVLDLSNTCSAVTPVEILGGFQPTIYVSFPCKKVVNATDSVWDSKEPSLLD